MAGISLAEFQQRRQQLIEKIRASQESQRNIVIIPASGKKYMTDKIPYVFRQNSDFFYLTGCQEPYSILVLTTDTTNPDEFKSILFMRPKNAHDELWDGPRTGTEHAVDFFGVDEAYPLTKFRKFVEDYSKYTEPSRCWYDEGAAVQPKLLKDIVSGRGTNATEFKSPTPFLHEQRVIKSAAEMDLMRRTCEIASQAVNDTMRDSNAGDLEHHIFARVDYHSRMRNASFLAYPPVVAAGNNATTIHYIDNTQVAKDGDLVLMDAGNSDMGSACIRSIYWIFFLRRPGCEYGGYSSDITRTWPIGGQFTMAQEILYDMIMLVQREILQIIEKHSANVTLNQLFEVMRFRLGKYLQEIGLIDKSLSDSDAAYAAYELCPHHVSHYLGMDIHDTPLIERQRKLERGMVFTVEPGIYISANNTSVPVEFRGIGIRIEDDVLIKSDGQMEILTQNCIKEKSQLLKLLGK